MARSARVAVAFALALGLTACDAKEEIEAIPKAGAPSPSPERTSPGEGERTKKDRPTRERPRTRPHKAKLTIASSGLDRHRVRRAVDDLKELGFWKRLTGPVARVRVSTRAGLGSIPEDGHLADTVRNVQLGPHPGFVCDVMIYSAALEADVDRQGVYYSEGRLSSPPPTLRQFWAVILAHELAHCSEKGQRGEAYSTRWEARVLDAYEASRIGSP